MTRQTWIELEPSDLAPQRKTSHNAVEVVVGLSPFDLPDCVRSFYDQSCDRFVIEFRYLNDEPLVPERADDYVTFFFGRNSDRLYKIEVDVKSLGAEQVDLKVLVPDEIADAFRKLERSKRFRDTLKRRRFRNHKIAAQVLEDRKAELLSEIK